MERFAYRPLRDAPRLAPLITAIGVSVFLQEAVRLFYPNGDRQRCRSRNASSRAPAIPIGRRHRSSDAGDLLIVVVAGGLR